MHASLFLRQFLAENCVPSSKFPKIPTLSVVRMGVLFHVDGRLLPGGVPFDLGWGWNFFYRNIDLPSVARCLNLRAFAEAINW